MWLVPKGIIIFFCLALFLQDTTATEKHLSSDPKTNLSVMQNLVETMAKRILDHVNIAQGESISLHFQEGEDMWIAQNSFLTTLRTAGYHVYSDRDTMVQQNVVFDVAGVDLNVKYNDMFREGIWGTKNIKRTITAALACRITTMKTHEVVLSKSLSESLSDTVAVEHVHALELESAKSTHAELPSEAFFDRIIEPFVIIGATGVIVYLFFHVRS